MAHFNVEMLGDEVYARLGRRHTAARVAAHDFDWRGVAQLQLTDSERFEARALWTTGSFTEYASGVAFASMATLLAQARAPIDLIAAASDMAVDEMAHVELVARLVAELGGAVPLAFEPSHIAPFADPGLSPLMQAVSVALTVSCVGENLSVPALAASRATSTVPTITNLLSRLLVDEASHAQFGYWVLDWACDRLSTDDRQWLAAAARQTLGQFEQIWQAQCATCVPHQATGGVCQPVAQQVFNRAVVRRIIEPLASYGIDVAWASR